MTLELVSVYSDGSSQGDSKGAVGWAYAVVYGENILASNFGTIPVGTNNTAELMGAIEGFKAFKTLKLFTPVELVSDSQYVLGLASGKYNPSKNVELAKEIRALTEELKAKTRWVRGHNGDKFNEVVDKLATKARMDYNLSQKKD